MQQRKYFDSMKAIKNTQSMNEVYNEERKIRQKYTILYNNKEYFL